MGIIHTLKALYRKSMISRILSYLDSDISITETQPTHQMNILDAMHMLKVAWSDVKQESVTNCFAMAGFVKHMLTLMCHLNAIVSLQRRISVHRSCKRMILGSSGVAKA